MAEGSQEFTGTGPWMTVVNPGVFLTWCAQCGEPFRKGGQAQRIEGGYGYRCGRHRPAGERPEPPESGYHP